MADSVSTNPAFAAPAPRAAKEASDGRPLVDDSRVTAVDRVEAAAASRKSEPVADAEIERLASEALKNSRLSIKRDGESGDFIYLMIDNDTGETVRRWPPETHTDLVEYLRSPRAGLLNTLA